MRRIAAIAVGLFSVASLAFAQTPQGQAPGGQGMGRRQPPPDHWMTIDSLSQTLNLTADQRTKITPSYTALNGVMKDAAAKRQSFRQQMQASGFQFGQEPTPEIRARMDSMRTEMDGLQAEADQWYTAIRNSLTPAQQSKLDALPKPQVAFRRPGGAPNPQ
jgi:Spy/CpxP family protein refolding chaperone